MVSQFSVSWCQDTPSEQGKRHFGAGSPSLCTDWKVIAFVSDLENWKRIANGIKWSRNRRELAPECHWRFWKPWTIENYQCNTGKRSHWLWLLCASERRQGSAMIRFEQIQYHEGFHEGFTGYDSSPWYRWPIEIDGLMMVYHSEKWVDFPWLC